MRRNTVLAVILLVIALGCSRPDDSNLKATYDQQVMDLNSAMNTASAATDMWKKNCNAAFADQQLTSEELKASEMDLSNILSMKSVLVQNIAALKDFIKTNRKTTAGLPYIEKAQTQISDAEEVLRVASSADKNCATTAQSVPIATDSQPDDADTADDAVGLDEMDTTPLRVVIFEDLGEVPAEVTGVSCKQIGWGGQEGKSPIYELVVKGWATGPPNALLFMIGPGTNPSKDESTKFECDNWKPGIFYPSCIETGGQEPDCMWHRPEENTCYRGRGPVRTEFTLTEHFNGGAWIYNDDPKPRPKIYAYLQLPASDEGGTMAEGNGTAECPKACSKEWTDGKFGAC